MSRIASIFSLCAAMALMATSAHADSLTVLDNNGDELAVFDRAALESMQMDTIETSTPWTEGVNRYEGVSLQRLLDAAGAKGDAYTAIALNDYAVSIPSKIIADHEPVVAIRVDGELLTLDNKGPYWVMFDFDSPEVQAVPEMRGLSIWALSEIEVE